MQIVIVVPRVHLPIVDPISGRKSWPAMNRCKELFPTRESPSSKTLYLTSEEGSLSAFGIVLRRTQGSLEKRKKQTMSNLRQMFREAEWLKMSLIDRQASTPLLSPLSHSRRRRWTGSRCSSINSEAPSSLQMRGDMRNLICRIEHDAALAL